MSIKYDFVKEGFVFIYRPKYFKDIVVPGNRHIMNLFLIEMISEIGKIFSTEISGNGSHQHKGIKKIIKEVKIKKDVDISVKEVKALFSSKTVKEIQFKKFKRETYEKIYFPYRVSYILGVIVYVLNLEEETKLKYNNKKSSSIADTFIPVFFKLFKAYVNRIDDQSRSSKIPLSQLNVHKEECDVILTELAKLND